MNMNDSADVAFAKAILRDIAFKDNCIELTKDHDALAG
jgi:hypothetical protein